MLHRYAPPQWRGAGSSPYGEHAASDARGPAAAMYWIHSTLDPGYYMSVPYRFRPKKEV